MILAYVNGSVGYVAIVSLVVQTWLLHVAACAVRCYVLGPYGPSSGITFIKMLRGLLHAIPTDPSLLHNKISKISIIVETKIQLIEDQRRKHLHITD
jgi:hypothetical protein